MKLERRYIITGSLNGLVAAILSFAVFFMVTLFFPLSGALRYIILISICSIMSLMVSFRPKWLIAVVSLLMFFIGLMLIILALNKEIYSQLAWSPSMLGAGAAIVALAITFYTTYIQRERKAEAIQLTDTERHISKSKENVTIGYIYLSVAIISAVYLACRFFNRGSRKTK